MPPGTPVSTSHTLFPVTLATISIVPIFARLAQTSTPIAQFAMELPTLLPAPPVPRSTLSPRAHVRVVQATAQLAPQRLSALLALPDSFC